MYGKFFASTFNGSMVGAGSTVFAVWGYVIANCQKGHVELNPKLLAMVLGDNEESIVQAIEYLCAPDPASRCKENEGRRMINAGPYFYEVPNHSTYRKILNEDERREYFRAKKQQQRERQKEKALTCGHVGQSKTVKDMSTVSTHAEGRGQSQKQTSTSPREVVVEAWNSLGHPFPKVVSLSSDRTRELNARLKDKWWTEHYEEALEVIRNSKFCRGETPPKEGRPPWIADFDFFIRPGSVAKALEGKYKNDKVNGNAVSFPEADLKSARALVGPIFERAEMDSWSSEEEQALRAAMPIRKEDTDLISKYYREELRKEKRFVRLDLLGFLKNYRGELDKARLAKKFQPACTV